MYYVNALKTGRCLAVGVLHRSLVPHASDKMETRPYRPPEAASAPAEEANARTQQLLELLSAGVEATKAEPGMRAYLTLLANLHDYSPQNCLLIAFQKPDATMVNAYARWKRLGRHVKRGERGLKIFYPRLLHVERHDPDTDQTETVASLQGFGIGNVWDVSQTDGDPLPPRPTIAHELGSDGAAALANRRLSAWLIDEGVLVESKDVPGQALAYYNGHHSPNGQIVIRRQPFIDRSGVLVDDPLSIGKTRALVHEAGHHIANHRGRIDRKDAEHVADGATYVAMRQLGIDVGELSFPYLALWGANDARLRDNVVEIGRVSRILSEIAEDYHSKPEHMREHSDWEGSQGQ